MARGVRNVSCTCFPSTIVKRSGASAITLRPPPTDQGTPENTRKAKHVIHRLAVHGKGSAGFQGDSRLDFRRRFHGWDFVGRFDDNGLDRQFLDDLL